MSIHSGVLVFGLGVGALLLRLAFEVAAVLVAFFVWERWLKVRVTRS
jgi:hypothetical protein